MKDIVFFYPDRNIGGGPYYLVLLANELLKKGYNVFYIDFIDGFAKKIPFIDKGIKFINYSSFIQKKLFWDKCYVFMPIYLLHIIPRFDPDSKILLFNWHNECLPVLNQNLQYNKDKLFNLLNLIIKNKAEVFCDISHWDYNNLYSMQKSDKQFVPVTLSESRLTHKKLLDKSEISIAILGRLVIDKIYAVINVLKCSTEFNKSKIKFYIIGNGEEKEIKKIKEFISINKINVKLCGSLLNEELDNFLINKIDILFAMGTSVLNGARLSIPAVIIPSEMTEFYCNSFLWLYDSYGFSLGWYVEQVHSLHHLNFKSFSEIMNDLLNNNLLIKKKCFNYFLMKHTPRYSASLLEFYLKHTSLNFNDLNTYLCKNQTLNVKKKNKVYIFGINILNITATLKLFKVYLFGKIKILSIKNMN